MNRFVTEAIVLKNTNYSDAHKFYSLLTSDHGKISALAMGVRKISSRRAGNLDTLNHISVSISESSRGFKTIDEVKTLNSFKYSKTDLNGIYYGLKYAEIIEYSVEQDHNIPEVFYLLLNTLELMDKRNLSMDLLEAWFHLGLSDLLGFKLDLDHCSGCGNVLDSINARISYSYEAGGFLCDRCGGFTVSVSNNVINLARKLRSENLEQINDSESFKVALPNLLNILTTHSGNLYTNRRVGEKTHLLNPEG